MRGCSHTFFFCENMLVCVACLHVFLVGSPAHQHVKRETLPGLDDAIPLCMTCLLMILVGLTSRNIFVKSYECVALYMVMCKVKQSGTYAKEVTHANIALHTKTRTCLVLHICLWSNTNQEPTHTGHAYRHTER